MYWAIGGKGDFSLGVSNQVIASGMKRKPYIYAGAHIATFSNFEGLVAHPLRLMEIYKNQNDFKDMFGAVAGDSYFLHVGDKEAFYEAEEFFKKRQTW